MADTPPRSVLFDDMESFYPIGADVQFRFHIVGPEQQNAKDEIRIYELGWSESSDYLTTIPSETWKIQPDSSSGLSYSAVLKSSVLSPGPDNIYQACFVSDNQVLGRSNLFRFQERSDSGDEEDDVFLVMKPQDVKRASELEGQLQKMKQSEQKMQVDMEAMQTALGETNRQLAEEKVYSEQVQGAVRVLVEEKEDLLKELMVLKEEMAILRGQFSEKDKEISSLQEVVNVKNQKINSLKTEMRDKTISLKSEINENQNAFEEEKGRLHYQLAESKERLKSAMDETALHQCHLENFKSLFKAQEGTKELLLKEIQALKEFKTQVSERVVNLTCENESLKEKVKSLQPKPKKEAMAETEPMEDPNKENVNPEAAKEAEKLQKKVEEMIDRLNAAAREYANLYKENKRQERIISSLKAKLSEKVMLNNADKITSNLPSDLQKGRICDVATELNNKASQSDLSLGRICDVAIDCSSGVNQAALPRKITIAVTTDSSKEGTQNTCTAIVKAPECKMCTPLKAAVPDVDAEKPMGTVIFENRNLKAENAVLDGFGTPSKSSFVKLKDSTVQCSPKVLDASCGPSEPAFSPFSCPACPLTSMSSPTVFIPSAPPQIPASRPVFKSNLRVNHHLVCNESSVAEQHDLLSFSDTDNFPETSSQSKLQGNATEEEVNGQNCSSRTRPLYLCGAPAQKLLHRPSLSVLNGNGQGSRRFLLPRRRRFLGGCNYMWEGVCRSEAKNGDTFHVEDLTWKRLPTTTTTVLATMQLFFSRRAHKKKARNSWRKVLF